MNKQASLLLSALISVYSGIAAAQCADVFIITFDAELYSPESESTIERRAFERLYAPPVLVEEIASETSAQFGGSHYNPNNVRALIKHDNQNYYIDRFGWIRHGEKYGKLDARAFEKRLARTCPQP